VGYKTHLSETCDEGYPDLITQTLTTLSTTPDCVMGPTIQQDLAQRDLLPGTHLVDTGYVDAELLVTAQSRYDMDVVGPPLASNSPQSRVGYGLEAFGLDWEGEQARCPQGHLSVNWRPGHDVSGDPHPL
jgi:transposase